MLGTKKQNPKEIDLKSETMRLYKNGEPAGEGSGAKVLGDPCTAVAWLANCLFHYGVPLQKGEIILSGAFSAAPAAVRGDVFRVEFSTFGTLEAKFL
jgi:2-keto-4-pentenoate hydratase